MSAGEQTDSIPPAWQLLERAAAKNLLDYVQAFRLATSYVLAAATDCAGGIAAYTGTGSPLTTIKGAGPDLSDDALDQAEFFFRKYNSPCVVFELPPWITPTAVERLTRRQYQVMAVEHVMLLDAPFKVPEPQLSIKILNAAEWADLVFRGFEAADTPAWHHLAEASALLPEATNLGVWDASADACIACAQMVPSAGVAIFSCDATLPTARGRGAQTALIRERLRLANAIGATCAAAEVAPDGISERNYLRCGFHLAYSRKHYVKNLG